jgi:hypothetical protein
MKIKGVKEADEFYHENFTGVLECCDGYEYVSGIQTRHMKNSRPHREDGPAIEWNEGSKQWWLNGEYYSGKMWKVAVANKHRKISQ